MISTSDNLTFRNMGETIAFKRFKGNMNLEFSNRCHTASRCDCAVKRNSLFRYLFGHPINLKA